MRKELHEYIDAGDERLIRMLYAVAKEYNDEDEEYEFTEEEIKELDESVNKYLRGESKAYTWEEAKELILKFQWKIIPKVESCQVAIFFNSEL